ncbi:MAG: TIR domain-containing protein [Candidatus Bathyarchaeia archaeon]
MTPPKYHIYLEYQDEEKSGIRFNLSEEELTRTFVTPFNSNKPFWLGGRLLSPSKVARVVIFWSNDDCSKLRLHSGECVSNCSDRKKVVESVCLGEISGVHLCTEKFLTPLKDDSGEASMSLTERRQVHVLHGKDEPMKQQVVQTLQKLGLEPVVLREQPNQGKTLLGEFSEYSDVTFAVVLLSPEDPSTVMLKVSQNLVLELGFFLGKLSSKRVMPLFRDVKGFVLPEGILGVTYTRFDREGTWRYKLAKVLQSNGFQVDINKIG